MSDSYISIAPMMDWTDRHCRYFHRLLAPNALLYTEMVTTGAILHGDRQRLLGFSSEEHPVALQLGGSDPADLAMAARIGEDFGYDEINLNVGCPSDRVQSGRFGACLMLEPETVAECVAAMQEAVQIPVTVKHRIGVDDQCEEEDLDRFVTVVSAAGCSTFIVHARKAWLSGLSPKENRDVPPLDYQRAWRIKSDFPDLRVIINGGIDSTRAVQEHLEHVDGVMLGRAAYHNPYWLVELEKALHGTPVRTREEFAAAMEPYLHRVVAQGGMVKHVTRHILGLFQGVPGAKAWRRHLSENAHLAAVDPGIIVAALRATNRTESSTPRSTA